MQDGESAAILRPRETGTKTLIVRFDIDSARDITLGVPSLLNTLEEFNIRAVFFVNMGRLLSRSELLFRSPGRTWRNLRPGRGTKIGLLSKFGAMVAFKTFLVNPLVGSRHPEILRRIREGGHELGLHGGMNHAIWQRRGDRLSYRAIARLADPALQAFRATLGPPSGFASPGFATGNGCREWLRRNGFRYSMNTWGEARLPDLQSTPPELPVTIAGPAGVPFLEYHDAQGTAPDTLPEVLCQRLKGDYACIYGHPTYEGLRRKDVFVKFVAAARREGFVTLTPLEFLEQMSR